MILEPWTLATDYVLAAFSLAFSVSLWRRERRAWALAFFFTACGSFFGGTHHGFGGEGWWRLTVYSIGAASLFLLWPFLRAVAITLFLVFALWMTVHDAFLYVIADYGLTLLLLAAVMIARPSPMSRWVLGSTVVSVIAALVQQAPIPHHNDVYHAIQLLALWLLYRGGTLMKTETSQPTTQPR